MREPPALPAATLLAALREGYGLDAVAAEFLPLGYDTAAAVFRVRTTGGADYFLKLRSDEVNAAGLAVPRWLHEQGVDGVLAPLPTTPGALWHPLGGCALSLYPFLHDAQPLPGGTADDQWRRLGATLRQVHAAQLPPGLAARLPRETFRPAATALARELDARVAGEAFDEPVQRTVAEAWRARAGVIRQVIEQAEALGERLRQRPAQALCLCHADPHWDNVLVDAAGRLWLVDWDDTLLALPERDLMFVVGGITADWGSPRDTALFLEGYGPAAVDRLALAYYRADWAVQDMADFARQALDTSGTGEVTRRDAARLFVGLFAPGAIVEKALGSEPF